MSDQSQKIERLKGKLALAVDLLRPFASELAEWEGLGCPDDFRPVWADFYSGNETKFTYGDLLRAAAFVAANDHNDGGAHG